MYELLLTTQLLQPFSPCLGFVECAGGALDEVAALYGALRDAALRGGGGGWSPSHSDALDRLDRRVKSTVIKPLTLQLEAAALAKLHAGFAAELGACAARLQLGGLAPPAGS